MKRLKRNILRARFINSATALGVLASAVKAVAQSVLVPPPVILPEETQPIAQRQDTNDAAGAEIVMPEPNAVIKQPNATKSFFQWGPIRLRPHWNYQFLYGTGVRVQATPGGSENTVAQTFSPGFLLELGHHWTLDYVPSFRFFSDSFLRDTLDHSISLNGFTTCEDWTLGLSQAFTRTDEPQIETGSQIEENIYSAKLNATYQFAPKMSIETDLGAEFYFVGGSATSQGLSDSRDYSVTDWLNYRIHPKLDVAVGVKGGYSEQDIGLQTTDEQILSRIRWHLGEKLILSLDGGVEDRQLLRSGQSDRLNPIFDASINYQLFKYTTLTVDASSSVDVSLFSDVVTETTQVNAGLQQRLLGQLQLTLGIGYRTSKYVETSAVFDRQRSDDTTSVNVGLGLPFLKHGNIGAFYQYSHDDSTDSSFAFSTHQTGINVSWDY